MSWIVIFWSMMAASSLTLAVIHLFVWFRRRGDYSHLLFFLLAVSAAATLRWAHVPLCAFVLSTVGFVYFYFGAGGALIAIATGATRLIALVLNFTTGANVNYRQVTGLDRLALWGG